MINTNKFYLNELPKEELINIIKELDKKVNELESRLSRFKNIEKHWNSLKGRSYSRNIKDIDIILDLRQKGFSYEAIAQYLTSLGPLHKATGKTVANRLKKYEQLSNGQGVRR